MDKKKKRARSAITGRFITIKKAKRFPKTSVVEKIS
jgi:hypothetical protein